MSYHTEAYPDYIAELKRRLGGVGEVGLSDELIGELWGSYSGWMSASWLIVDDGTFGNFTAWLIHCILEGRVLDGSRAAPFGYDFSTLRGSGETPQP